MTTGDTIPVLIVGAGPAGLTAAYELVRLGIPAVVLEKAKLVGGISRTEEHGGFRYDIGGHRFFTKVPEVEQFWEEVLGDHFIKVPRLSRILYKNKYYDYPIELKNTLSNLGIIESGRILLSYLRWKARPFPAEETFEQWVTNRFGQRLYRTFFRTYTEKVWGIPCSEIRADWAAQRIRGMSLKSAVWAALTGKHNTSTLIKEFRYPKLGPGMMWERVREVVQERGGRVEQGVETVQVLRDGNRITSVVIRQDGQDQTVAAREFISTMPLDDLIQRIEPAPPAAVRTAAAGLKYRDFLIVGLVLRGASQFADNWIYIHDPGVRVGRIQNFGNWSAAMVPEPGVTSLGLEYFCNRGDDIWEMADDQLIQLASEELSRLGLGNIADVVSGRVIRQPKAYPVYDEDYRGNLDVIRQWLGTLENFQTVGRNGMHRYNNQDHSMLTAMLAVRNLMGETHDLWEVNVEKSYHEESTTRESSRLVRAPGELANVS